jgi:DNA-directed RNA polymerase specialized sigma24 family protein
MMDVLSEFDSMFDLSARSAPLKTLLERLALDDDVAKAYQKLHLRLATYFRLRFPVEAEALADEAIDRLARRLADGTSVDNPLSYALGIARFLALEAAARQKKQQQAARDAALELEQQQSDVESDPALPALQACLGCLDPDSARLILEYYALDGGAARIERRQRMAERLGMTLNALRNKALRTRMALERCVRARLRPESPAPDRDISPRVDTKNIMQPSRPPGRPA